MKLREATPVAVVVPVESDGLLASVVRRIAAATSALRTRSNDAARYDVHGGTIEELAARMNAQVTRLERVAAQLEERLG